MDKRVRRITISAMLTALAVVMLYMSAILPTMRLAFVAIAGLLTAVAILECGIGFGIMVFAASGILGFLISPLRGNVLVYCLFFGYYPILKGLFEKVKTLPLEWALKVLLFNVSLSAALLLYRSGFLSGVDIPNTATALIYAAANIAFIIYDIGFSRLMSFYLFKFKKNR